MCVIVYLVRHLTSHHNIHHFHHLVIFHHITMLLSFNCLLRFDIFRRFDCLYWSKWILSSSYRLSEILSMWSWYSLWADLHPRNTLEWWTEILWLALQRSMQHWVNCFTNNFRIYAINNCHNFKAHWLFKYISHNSRLYAKFVTCLITTMLEIFRDDSKPWKFLFRDHLWEDYQWAHQWWGQESEGLSLLHFRQCGCGGDLTSEFV